MTSRRVRTGCSPGQLTRKQVAELLQVSTSSVRRLEGTHLQPEQDEHGVWWFDPAEVEALVRAGTTRQRRAPAPKAGPETAGDAAARVFRMFGQNKGLREIVVGTRQTPERVRELYRQWLVGLRAGERQRQEAAEHERERREQADDERAQLELIRAMRA